MSKEKGARFERELASLLRQRGFNARRGQQFSGANGDPDVVGLDGVHIEAKHCEQMRLYDWMNQSIRDAKVDEIPVVMHRQNYKGVLVTMLFDDFINLYIRGEANQ